MKNGQLSGKVIITGTDSPTSVGFSSGPAELLIVRQGAVVGRAPMFAITAEIQCRVTEDHPAILRTAVEVKSCPVGGDDSKRAPFPPGNDYRAMAVVVTSNGQLVTNQVPVDTLG